MPIMDGSLHNVDFYLKKPDRFDFKVTIYSHGWVDLKPFVFDEEKWNFTYSFRGTGKVKPIRVTISETDKRLKISTGRRVSANIKSRITSRVKHMLRLDEDFGQFYRLARKHKGLRWVTKLKAGRLVRSPNVFEDLVKTICTTNCSWGLTKSMVANLVDQLGEPIGNEGKCFPTATAMALKNEKFYREKIRAGYRSPYFVELAESVASGKLNPEQWLKSDLPTEELKREIKKIKGVGNYAAENLLKLVGRYDGLALDSFLRSEFYKKHNNGKSCSDKKIEKFYSGFGDWKGLAIWFDMTQRFFEEKAEIL